MKKEEQVESCIKQRKVILSKLKENEEERKKLLDQLQEIDKVIDSLHERTIHCCCPQNESGLKESGESVFNYQPLKRRRKVLPSLPDVLGAIDQGCDHRSSLQDIQRHHKDTQTITSQGSPRSSSSRWYDINVETRTDPYEQNDSYESNVAPFDRKGHRYDRNAPYERNVPPQKVVDAPVQPQAGLISQMIPCHPRRYSEMMMHAQPITVRSHLPQPFNNYPTEVQRLYKMELIEGFIHDNLPIQPGGKRNSSKDVLATQIVRLETNDNQSRLECKVEVLGFNRSRNLMEVIGFLDQKIFAAHKDNVAYPEAEGVKYVVFDTCCCKFSSHSFGQKLALRFTMRKDSHDLYYIDSKPFQTITRRGKEKQAKRSTPTKPA